MLGLHAARAVLAEALEELAQLRRHVLEVAPWLGPSSSSLLAESSSFTFTETTPGFTLLTMPANEPGGCSGASIGDLGSACA